MDQTMPRTDDLYLTLSSLRVRLTRTSRCANSSRSRSPIFIRGGSLVRTRTSASATDSLHHFVDGLLERRHRPDFGRSRYQTGERRVRRTAGRPPQFIGLLRGDLSGKTRLVHRPGEEIVPRGDLRSSEMYEAAVSREHHRDEPLRQVSHVRGRPDQIDDGRNALSRSQATHRAGEKILPPAEHPRSPNHEMFRSDCPRFPLPRQLAPPVDRDRVGGVELVVRLALLAVEHVVGGDVHEDRPGSSGRQSHVARAHRIRQERPPGILLAAVDRCHGGSMDDHLWPRRYQEIHHGRVVLDGQVSAREGNQIVLLTAGSNHRPAKRPRRPGDRDPHSPVWKSSPTRMATAAPRRIPRGAGRTTRPGTNPFTTSARFSLPFLNSTSLRRRPGGASLILRTMKPARCSAACTCSALSPPSASSTTTLMVAGEAS